MEEEIVNIGIGQIANESFRTGLIFRNNAKKYKSCLRAKKM